MAQLADAVVLVAQGAPALVFLDEAVLQVVLVGERPVAVVDVSQMEGFQSLLIEKWQAGK